MNFITHEQNQDRSAVGSVRFLLSTVEPVGGWFCLACSQSGVVNVMFLLVGHVKKPCYVLINTCEKKRKENSREGVQAKKGSSRND